MSKTKTEMQAYPSPAYHFHSTLHNLLLPQAWIYIKGTHYFFYLVDEIDKKKVASTYTKDFIHWQDHPVNTIGLPEDIDSFHLIPDQKNLSGLGTSSKPAWILFFTRRSNSEQIQIVYSTDLGITWKPHKGHVLDIKPASLKDVFILWHEASSKWIMILTLPQSFKIRYYASKNLLKWDFLNDFGGHPSFKKPWDYAFMTPLRVRNQEMEKWILAVSTKGEYSSTRYFVGSFDGKYFSCDHALDQYQYIDCGKDFYAPRPCSPGSSHHQWMIGWMDNTTYHDLLPTQGWKGQWSLVREMVLNKESDGSYKMIQQPAQEYHSLRTNHKEFTKSPVTTELEWPLELTDAMEFEIKIDSNKGCSLEFDFGTKAKMVLIWDVVKNQIQLDRTAKPFQFLTQFASLDTAKLSGSHTLQVRVLLDKYSLEVFIDGGKIVLTNLFFGQHSLQRFRIIGKQFAASGQVWNLRG